MSTPTITTGTAKVNGTTRTVHYATCPCGHRTVRGYLGADFAVRELDGLQDQPQHTCTA